MTVENDVLAEQVALGLLQVMPPQVLGAALVARPDVLEHPAMGLVGGLPGAPDGGVGGRLERRVRHLDDVVQHLVEQRQRLVAGQADEEGVEVAVQPDRLARVLGHGFLAAQRRFENVQIDVRAVEGELADARHLQGGPGVVDVPQRDAPVLQGEGSVAGGDLAVRRLDARTAPGAPADGDQVLRLKHAERFSQRGAGDPEPHHQVRFRRQGVSLGELAADDLAAQVGGDQLSRFRHSDELVGAVGRLAQRLTPRADHAAVLMLREIFD